VLIGGVYDNPLSKGAADAIVRWAKIMNWIAAGTVSLAIAMGLALVSRHAQARPVPLAFGLAHAATALVAVGVLTAAAVAAGDDYRLNSALICLVLALVGGAFNLLFRLEGERPPGFMIVLHALAGVAGLVLVWLAVV